MSETQEEKELKENEKQQPNSENKVFQYNGKWAYKSPIDDSLFIYENNEWIPESKLLEMKSTITTTPKEKILGKRNKDEINLNKKNNNRNKKSDEQLLEESTVIYISGLPNNNKDKCTNHELHQIFRKAGFVSEDSNQKPKIIQFINEDTKEPRGDAILCYERKESIPLAILQLDETEIKENYKIKVEKATLEQSNYFKLYEESSNDTLLQNKKPKKDKRKQNQSEKKFGWSDSESKCIIIKNLFSIEESLEDPNFFNQLQEDLEDPEHGCGKCGEISSIAIFQRNPNGVASIKFKDFESAEKCVALMNGRYFAGRQLEADFYDGFTDYFVQETDQEAAERLKKWESWLEKNGGEDQ